MNYIIKRILSVAIIITLAFAPCVYSYVDVNGQESDSIYYDDDEPDISENSLLVVKNKTGKLNIDNYPGKVVWTSFNTSIATVNASGLVTGKKIGNVIIIAKDEEGETYGCVVSVVSKKIKKVVKQAYKLGKGKYSQPKRMKKGYYDCSSLVWRAYKKAKIKIVTKYYAPVAATIARYYVKKKKRRIKGGYKLKNVASLKYRPGDLLFCEGARNGRYRGIFHVEMFTGYAFWGFDQKGNAIITAKWPTKPNGHYFKEKSLMVRPVK